MPWLNFKQEANLNYHEIAPDALIVPGENGGERSTIVAKMQALAPPNQAPLDGPTIEELRSLTSDLLSLDRENMVAEFDRFNGIKERGLHLDSDKLSHQLANKTVLVTGGTGCIGSTLLEELAPHNPKHIVSVSRGITPPWKEQSDVEYLYHDIRDAESMDSLFRKIKPDIVYHLAAQHSPAQAEVEVCRTLSTNITGARNIINAARASGTPQIVHASTGKTIRPFTPNTYAASKKVSEWLMADAASQGDILVSGARFTHVVDNSIIGERLKNWIATGTPIRLHGADIMFYLQSARESAQLVLNAGLDAAETDEGEFRLHAINNLGWPVKLSDLALGAIAKSGKPAAIYFCGFEDGYEELPYPGLYDPIDAGGVSPLINSFESPSSRASVTCQEVDCFPFFVRNSDKLMASLQTLEIACAENAPCEVLHEAKNILSWDLLDGRLAAIDKTTLERVAYRMQKLSEYQQMSLQDARINQAVYNAIEAMSGEA